jgi:hypothetical protein
MSTIVQMPVRVKPPPAETGDTISPGCASFEIATPENGARITMSSMAVCCRATCCSATAICSRSEATRATRAFTSAFALSISAAVTRPSFARRSRRACTRRASSRRTSASGTARRAASSCARASASAARIVESSRRASTWPSRTLMPSSTFTSTTLPVTFDETVARRRAVT